MSRLFVHSHSLHGSLLAGLLAQFCGLEIQRCCSEMSDAWASIDRWEVDLLLLECDACRPCSDPQRSCPCLGLVRHLLRHHPGAGVILSDPAGSHSILPADLQPAVVALLDPRLSWVELLGRLQRHLGTDGAAWMPDPSRLSSLRPRERSVLQLLGRGLVSKEIAHQLGLTLRTVETYRKTISAKLGVSGAQLVRVAVLQACVEWCPAAAPAGRPSLRPLASPPPPAAISQAIRPSRRWTRRRSALRQSNLAAASAAWIPGS